jgi:hypothetical protein
LEDGGVLYIIPSFAHNDNLFLAPSDTVTARDSLVKADGNSGRILWKICISNSKGSWGVSNPYVLNMTTSPNGDLFIGGTAVVAGTSYPAFIYKIRNVGHIYDPIPQASPTATQPQWQERKARLAIYPNPAKRGEAFSYSLPAEKAGGLLEIFGADGRRVYSQALAQSSGSVSIPAHVRAGLYLVRAGGLEAKWVVEN